MTESIAYLQFCISIFILFLNFDAVSHLPEEESEDDDEEDKVQSVSCSSSSSSSQSIQPASLLSSQLVCKNFNVLQKDIAMGCGHLICFVYFEKLKEDRKTECADVRGKKTKKRASKNFALRFSWLWPVSKWQCH